MDLLLVSRRHRADGRLRHRARRRAGTANRPVDGPAGLRGLLRPPDGFRSVRADTINVAEGRRNRESGGAERSQPFSDGPRESARLRNFCALVSSVATTDAQ